MNKKFIVLIIAVVLIALFIGGYFLLKEEKISDAKRFKEEYSLVKDNNIFVYKTSEEIIHILEKGTGVVYLGFPECPWCQAYVPYLEQAAEEAEIKKIYYFNILIDRKNNTKDYQKIVSLLEKKLLADDEGNPRVFVPDVSIVKNGTILGHDNETSVVTKADGEPKDYWTEDRVTALIGKLKTSMIEISENICKTCEK